MKRLFIIPICFAAIGAAGQTIEFKSADAFRQIPSSWKQAGGVRAELTANNVLVATVGAGIWVNTSSDKQHGTDLYSQFQHGDADIEFDYMLARNANSGIYLQGRYEVQLFDSWGKPGPASYDNGGIYERWDDAKPEGNKGYGGIPPRQNVSRAPGTWQHMKISFSAPRFDASGKKVENARISRVELNGVLIHENVELFGPTRGGDMNEAANGPLRIQGDHGSIAFRNLHIIPFDKERPELINIRYQVYKGIYRKEPDYASVAPEAQGNQVVLTGKLNSLPDTFLIRYTGTLKINEAGEYRFKVITVGGRGELRIDKKTVTSINENEEKARVTLQQGEHNFELVFHKVVDWAKPAVGVYVSGPGIREFLLSDADDMTSENTDPILVQAVKNTLLRSFMDIPDQRVIHAVSVGSEKNVHYTYDMDRGAIVQVWRGGFLDATPMWHERGDGSARPTGTVQLLGKPTPLLALLSNEAAAWPTDTTNTGFRVKGYKLDPSDQPVFRYLVHGSAVTDAIRVAENNGGVTREIQVNKAPAGLYARLAAAEQIADLGNGLFLVGDNNYYIRLQEGGKTMLRDNGGKKELLVPVQSKIVYTLLF